MEYLLQTGDSDWIGAAIANTDHDLHTPALCDVEVAAALRRALVAGFVDEVRAEESVEDYLDLPVTRHGHQLLVPRILELRHNFSAYDATYVALAEVLGGHLLTADGALASATRTHVEIPLIAG